MQLVINFTTYDGTAKTRPHSIRLDYFDQSEKQRAKIEQTYCLIRKESGELENVAFHLRPSLKWLGKRWVCPTCKGAGCVDCDYSGEQDNEVQKFECWKWESRWPDYAEDNFEYPLEVGDMWAPWPSIGK